MTHLRSLCGWGSFLEFTGLNSGGRMEGKGGRRRGREGGREGGKRAGEREERDL